MRNKKKNNRSGLALLESTLRNSRTMFESDEEDEDLMEMDSHEDEDEEDEDLMEMDSHEDDEDEDDDLEESRKLRSENAKLQKKLMRVKFARALQESLSKLPESHHSRFVSSLPPANSFKTVESFKTALVVAESAYRKGAAATISESKKRQPKTQNQAQAPKAISGKQGQRVTDPFGILGEGINMFEMMNKY